MDHCPHASAPPASLRLHLWPCAPTRRSGQAFSATNSDFGLGRATYDSSATLRYSWIFSCLPRFPAASFATPSSFFRGGKSAWPVKAVRNFLASQKAGDNTQTVPLGATTGSNYNPMIYQGALVSCVAGSHLATPPLLVVAVLGWLLACLTYRQEDSAGTPKEELRFVH
ncbi:hypothetical protein Taro_048616 [Colocasia esculenta]|uniref:Uncharacterized protein n=1 Tax=Colocasia esculenta TaxID=4460 RepID=A0A843X8L8_COLES|nr:hypothetical protein [Colocasia esculenta]